MRKRSNMKDRQKKVVEEEKYTYKCTVFEREEKKCRGMENDRRSRKEKKENKIRKKEEEKDKQWKI